MRYLPARYRLKEFLSFIHLAKQLDKKLIWTVHNLEPHETSEAAIGIAFEELAKKASLIIVHDEHTKGIFKHRYASIAPVFVMKHGTYEGAYPPARDRQSILSELGISRDNKTIISCLGQIRDYKGSEIACEAAAKSSDLYTLLVAGRAREGFDLSKLQSFAGSFPNIHLLPHELTPQQFSDLHSITDICLYPYKKITGSGAIMAGITYAKPFVASKLPFFESIHKSEPLAGELFQVGETHGMICALSEIRKRLDSEDTRSAISRLRARYQWANCVDGLYEAIAAILR